MNANGTALWLVGWGRKRGEEVQRMALNATAAGLGTDFSMAAEGLLRYVMSETSSQKFSSEAIISENKCFRRKRYGFSHCCWAFSLQEPLMPFSVSSQSTKSELCPPPLGDLLPATPGLLMAVISLARCPWEQCAHPMF